MQDNNVLIKDIYFDVTADNELDIKSFKFIKFYSWIHNNGGYTKHFVVGDEVGFLDLISYREYGSEAYWWIIAVANNLLDPIEEVILGKELIIPTTAAINQYIATLRVQESNVMVL